MSQNNGMAELVLKLLADEPMTTRELMYEYDPDGDVTTLRRVSASVVALRKRGKVKVVEKRKALVERQDGREYWLPVRVYGIA